MVIKEQNEDLAKKNIDSKKIDSDQYLTEMKELPPVFEDIDKGKKFGKPVDKNTAMLTESRKANSHEEKDSSGSGMIQNQLNEKGLLENENENIDKKRLPISSKDIILGVINLISVIFLIIILSKFPQKAQEFKNLRIEGITNETNRTIEFPEITDALSKASKMESYFLDEGGIVNFVDDLEKIKGKDEVIKKITFSSQKVIKDKTGNSGYPVMIEMSGSWEMIDLALQDITKLPYLFRSAKLDIEKDEKENMIIFNYGIFLYVNPKLGENR